MDIDKLKAIIERNRNTETEVVEFKVNNNNPSEIGERISGLINTALLENKDRAYLIFGIEDNGNIVGTTIKLEKVIGKQDLEMWLQQKFTPKPHISVHQLDIDDKRVVVLELFPPSSAPLDFFNVRYIRIGTYTSKLRDYPDKERIIWKNISSRSFEEDLALDHLTQDEALAKIEYVDFFKYLDESIPTTNSKIIIRLIEYNVIKQTDSGYAITNLGAILLARDLRDFAVLERKMIRVIIYRGNTKDSVEKEYEIRAGYLAGFNHAMEWIKSHMPVNEELKAALRQDHTRFPIEAIREILGNAIIHQDFSISGAGPVVEVYEKSLEVINPGAPLIEEVDRLFNYSRSRNEKLASLGRKLGMCEERGSGLRRVLKWLDIFQLPPLRIATEDEFTHVILMSYRPFRTLNNFEKTYACYQHCVLRYLDDNQSMTNTSLRERFKLKSSSNSSVSKVIAATLEANLIKPRDPKSNSKKFAKYMPYWS